MIYLASKVKSALSAKTNPPSTITVFNTGVDSSTIITCPAGTITESPSLGGISPPQVASLDQAKP